MLESKHYAADGVVVRLQKYIRAREAYHGERHRKYAGQLVSSAVYRVQLWATAWTFRNLFLWDLEAMIAQWASPKREEWCYGSLADCFALNSEQPELAKQNRDQQRRLEDSEQRLRDLTQECSDLQHEVNRLHALLPTLSLHTSEGAN
jgi:hypothetical protein